MRSDIDVRSALPCTWYKGTGYILRPLRLAPSDWSSVEWFVVVVMMSTLSMIGLFFANEVWAKNVVALLVIFIIFAIPIIPVIAALNWLGVLTTKEKCPKSGRRAESPYNVLG